MAGKHLLAVLSCLALRLAMGRKCGGYMKRSSQNALNQVSFPFKNPFGIPPSLLLFLLHKSLICSCISCPEEWHVFKCMGSTVLLTLCFLLVFLMAKKIAFLLVFLMAYFVLVKSYLQ